MNSLEFRATLGPAADVTVTTSFGPLVFPMRMVDVRQGAAIVDTFPVLDAAADFDKVCGERGWSRAGYDPTSGEVILRSNRPALTAPPPPPAPVSSREVRGVSVGGLLGLFGVFLLGMLFLAVLIH